MLKIFLKTREKILDKALALFNEQGFSKVKVRDIARALDISPGNLSYHFPKKEDLMQALVSKHSENVNLAYTSYFDHQATIQNFLKMVYPIIKSHFYYRGLLMSPHDTLKILESKNFNYAASYNKRIRQVRRVFENLMAAKQIRGNQADIDFLVSFFSLFIRFSIAEAHLMPWNRNEEEVITYYMDMISHQIQLFATPEGLASLKEYKTTDLTDA